MPNDILDIYLILDKKKYSKIYNIHLILIVLILIFIYVIFTYKYQSYYTVKGKCTSNLVELIVNINDIKYIELNNKLVIDNTEYTYQIERIDTKLYTDSNYQNYKYVYLNIKGINNIDNYIYQITIPKEYKALAKYLKEYL